MSNSNEIKKPVRLEFNNSGSWETWCRFDAADDEQASQVMATAVDLVKTKHNSEDPKRCPTLRISMDDGLGAVITRWALDTGWTDAVTGLPV